MATPLSDDPFRPRSQTIAVVGLGTMGTGIAEVLARAGREVVGIDISEAAAAQAVAALEASTARAVRARAAHRAGARRTSSPASAPSPTCGPRPTPTWSSRWSRSRTRSSSRSSASSTAIVRPEHDPGDRHQRPVRDPAGRRLGRAPSACSACTSSTRRPR